MTEIEEILQFFDRASDGNAKSALATVISTNGPSYRSPGARSLVCDDGTFRGGLSAGCLEADIACRLDGGKEPFVVQYDLSSADDVRGFPFGCGGNVEIFVEPLAGEAALDALRWLSCLDEPAVMITVIRSDERAAGSRYGVSMSGEAQFGDDLGLEHGDRLIRTAFETKKSLVVEMPGGKARIFVEYFEPAVSLTIFGDGEDALMLADFAGSVGMRVNRVSRKDIRASKNEKSQLTITNGCYCAVMTHDLNLDAQALEAALKAEPRYLGIMGPKSRTERLLSMLDSEYRQLAERVNIYAPIGLDMRAETPREIALSIVAEIQSVARMRRPAHLRDVQGAIHDRKTDLKVVGAILAAGGSSRFGSSKQLARVDGETLIERAQKVLLDSRVDDACVILGCNADTIRGFVSDRVTVLNNENWHEGIASSIRACVEHAMKQNASHLLVMLCDQPHVSPAVIDQLLALSRVHRQSIIACDYGDTVGVPAVFPREKFAQILQLEGDRGAKSIIASAPDTKYVHFPAGLIDVDRPEDLAVASSKY